MSYKAKMMTILSLIYNAALCHLPIYIYNCASAWLMERMKSVLLNLNGLLFLFAYISLF